MHKTILSKLKAVAMQLVIAFLFTAFIISIMFVLFGSKARLTVSLVNKFLVFNTDYEKKEKVISIDPIKKRLNEYPSYGEAFGNIYISNLGIDNVIYHGEALSILKYGVGHHAGSYFPGEGGTIIIAGHNTHDQFYNLPNIKKDEEIVIKTNYGTFTYQVDETEIVEAKILGHNLKVSNDAEELMLYTCYPVETPGLKSKRFVVYARLVGEVYEK